MEALLMAKRTHLPINSEAIKDFLINNDWQTADSEEAISIAFVSIVVNSPLCMLR